VGGQREGTDCIQGNFGQWQPIVTTEEFERGLEILAERMSYRIVKRRHDYLLKSLIYVQ
jgi:hypothetical protein